MKSLTRPKLAWLSTAGIAAFLFLVGFLVLVTTTKALRGSIEEQLAGRAGSLAQLLGSASAFQLDFRGSGAEIETFVASVADQADVVFVAVALPDGTLVSDARGTESALVPEDRFATVLGETDDAPAREGKGMVPGRLLNKAGSEYLAYRTVVHYEKAVETNTGGGYDDLLMGEATPAPQAGSKERVEVGVVYVALSKASMMRDLAGARGEAVVWMLGAVLLVIVVVAGATFWLTRPMRGMVEAAEAMAGGEYEDLPQLEPRGFEIREVAQLGEAFAAMGDRFAEIGLQARRIADGDLSQGIAGGGKLGADFNSMVESLSHLVGQIKKASLQIASSSSEILAASKQAEKGSAEQASSIAQTTTTMDELLSASKQIASSADSVVQIAEKTLGAAQAGEDAVQESINGMTEIADNNRQTAERTLELSEKNQEIGNVVDLIDEIADKSDLLALNAAIEGAKAGEAGKGFAVVATEMRALAENVISSTKEIKGLISEIQKASNASVLATEGQMKATERGTNTAEKTASHLQQILQMVEQTTEAAKQISLATQQQRTGTEQVVQSMSEIAKIAKSNVAGAGQTTSSTVELASLADELRQAVSRFQLGSDDG